MYANIYNINIIQLYKYMMYPERSHSKPEYQVLVTNINFVFILDSQIIFEVYHALKQNNPKLKFSHHMESTE